MFKYIISSLTLASLLFVTATSTRAELAPDALTIRSNTSAPAVRHQPRQLATNSQRSMGYVKMGLDAQKQGNPNQALEYYYQAVKTDNTNAVAFLLAGSLLGETDDGIACIKAAMLLFQAQENQEGYELAVAWLKAHNIAP
ncbi:hypothetical protein [Chamaesiphon sp. OTE_8_metabat_110]|uniref:hypothetical protein n=1 Tax=Chamaesiphon sp. OTE_8_metabat_110 TaxID=2964696 RepID=UPI00286C5FAA|nr:hypothetical protein [Chamaesiphon sp. OTE_8_metabat_110]